MAKFFSVSKGQAAIFGTLAFLIFLGACYFFIYIPANEKIVQERRFRCLQNIDSNIHTKITNTIGVINTMLPDSAKDLTSLNARIDSINKVIELHPNYSKNSFTLLPYKKNDTTEKNKDPKVLTFLANKPAKVGDASIFTPIGAKYQFDQFIKPLLPAEVFDNYIVFIHDKTNSSSSKTDKGDHFKKVYESFASGINLQIKDSVLEAKSGITAPGMHYLNVGGDDYRVFSQQGSIDNNRELIILGLVLDKNYLRERNQLPLGVVLFLLTTAIGMIVSFPWIKLYHMGSKDKLTVTDGISSVLVSMILMSLLFFVIFKYSIYPSADHRGYPNFSTSRNALATKLTSSFEKELNAAYKVLNTCDSVYNQLKINNEKKISTPRYDGVLKSYEGDIKAHQVFWLDAKGIVTNSWSADIKIKLNSNFSERKYFGGIRSNNLNNIAEPSFYVDQVVSHTSGVFITVIAKKSINKTTTVAALGFTAKSLTHVIMPDGYMFAIIDSKGKVLYHSKTERNLNENLTKEFADSSSLVSSLQAKSDTSFDAEYYGRPYNIKIMPFAHLPYYTIIFEDKEYLDARDTEPYAFTVSMLVCFLAFMIVQISVIFFVSSSRSFFKKQLFDTSWVGPKTTSLKQYNQAILGNSIITILLIFFFIHSTFLTYIYILLFAITFVNILLNSIFALSYRGQNKYSYRFKVNAIKWLCLFVAAINYAAWVTLSHQLYWLASFWQLALFEVLCVSICTLIYKADAYLNSTYRQFLLAISLALGSPHFKKWSYTKSFAIMATTRLIITSGIPVAFFFIYSFNYEQSLDTRYRQLTFASALTQKIITDSLTKPRAVIYKPEASTGSPKADISKQKQHAGKRKPNGAKFKINDTSKFIIDSLGKGKIYTAGVYADGVFIHDFELYNISEKDLPKILPGAFFYTREDSITANILSAFRLYRNNIALRSNNLNFPPANNDAFVYPLTLRHVSDTDRSYFCFKAGQNEYIKVSSGRINYPPMIRRFWALLIFLIVVFYYIIHNIIRKLFALNLPSTNGWELMDDKLMADNKLNSLLFILGSPGSGKLNKLKKRLKRNKLDDAQEKELQVLKDKGDYKQRDEKLALYKTGKLLGNNRELLVYDENDKSKSNVFIADLINIATGDDDADWVACKQEALENKYAMVVINHFEYNIRDSKTNSTKLDFLESLMQKGTSKILVISTVHPLTFLDSYSEQQKKAGPDQKPQPGINESELERWHVLLGHFRIVIEPLNDIAKIDRALSQSFKNEENAAPIKHAIFEETRYSHYLNNMQQMALTTTPLLKIYDIDDISDSLIFKLQITSHYFYTYIWQSLTKEEKFLLYDLAEDGLVNPCDDYNLSMLICKGLIIRPKGTLTLFNRGFRNFILTAIGNTEVNRIKDQVKDNGNWASLKTPLIIAILAIFVFLMASQQSAYTQIITYITALGAGVPAVLKIFSLFPDGSKQKTA